MEFDPFVSFYIIFLYAHCQFNLTADLASCSTYYRCIQRLALSVGFIQRGRWYSSRVEVLCVERIFQCTLQPPDGVRDLLQ